MKKKNIKKYTEFENRAVQFNYQGDIIKNELTQDSGEGDHGVYCIGWQIGLWVLIALAIIFAGIYSIGGIDSYNSGTHHTIKNHLTGVDVPTFGMNACEARNLSYSHSEVINNLPKVYCTKNKRLEDDYLFQLDA